MSRNLFLLMTTFLCGAPQAFAQMPMGQPYPPQYPAMPMQQAYPGYPPAYQQYRAPVQPVQYRYYGNVPTPYPPAARGFYPQRPSYPPTVYGYNNGYGVNYHYVQNPIGFSSTPAPYSAVANNNALGRPTIIQDPRAPLEEEVVEDLGPTYPEPTSRGPALGFHRETNESCWVSAEYVGMFLKPMGFSGPLATTGSQLDPQPGALGRPSTAVLYGDKTEDYGLMSGLRIEVGAFLDAENRTSIEMAGFWTLPGKRTFSIAGDSGGNPVISRPVFNIADGREGAFVNTIPATVTGNFIADLRSDIGGVEINGRYHYYHKERLHVDGLLGFRYMRLYERLQILENISNIQQGFLTFLGAPIGVGESLIDDDLFRTTNQFFGPQIGGRVSWEQQWLTATAFAKVGLGVTHQVTHIAGTTTRVSPNGNEVANGGILALPTNNGTHQRTVFGILPEFGIQLGAEVCQHVRVKVGYSVLLWSHVVRPGSQFDRNVNPGQVPGSPTFGTINGPFGPTYRFNDEFFWTHSFNIGVDFHF